MEGDDFCIISLIDIFLISFIINIFIVFYSLYNLFENKLFHKLQGSKLNIKKNS